MSDDATSTSDAISRFELYKLYLATAEKVSDRRAQANAWMLSVNSAIVGLYGYLQTGKQAPSDTEKEIWLWAIPAAGAIVCLAWASLLTSYSRLNGAKFKVLHELEADFPIPLFKREWEHYRKQGRKKLSKLESRVPWTFALLYAIMIIAALWNIIATLWN